MKIGSSVVALALVWVLLAGVLPTQVAAAPSAPSPISPGSSSGPGPVESMTPTLSWSSVAAATNYQVAVSKYPYGENNVVFTQGFIDGTSVQVPSGKLEPDMRYRWNVQAWNDDGPSGWSSRLYFQTAGSSSSPSAPGAPTATSPGTASSPGTEVGSLTPTLYWTAPSGATSYKVSVRECPCPSGPLVVNAESTTSTSYPISSGRLQDGHAYRWNVQACNSAGCGTEWSNTLYFQTAGSPSVPGAPTGLTVTSTSQSEVNLQWSPPGSNGGSSLTHYRIYRGTSSGAESFYLEIGADWTTFRNTGSNVDCGTTYHYKVTAVNNQGEGARSTGVSATTTACPSENSVEVPTAPRNFAATPDDGHVVLTWSAPTNNGGAAVTSYRIYRGTASGTTNQALVSSGSCANLGDVRDCVDSGLQNGQTYYYHAKAINTAGEGEASYQRSATPYAPSQDPAPAAPTNLQPGDPASASATSTTGQILSTTAPTLTWKAPSGGADKYGVYVSQGPSFSALVLENEAVTGTSLPVNLDCGATYRWNIRAYSNAGGWGNFAPNPDRMYFTTKKCDEETPPTQDQPTECDNGHAAISMPEAAKHALNAGFKASTPPRTIDDAVVILAIAWAESGGNPLACNNQGNDPPASWDRGILQFNSHWHPEVVDTCAFDAFCSFQKAHGLPFTQWTAYKNGMYAKNGRIEAAKEAINDARVATQAPSTASSPGLDYREVHWPATGTIKRGFFACFTDSCEIFHAGIDIPGSLLTPVYSPFSGKVALVDDRQTGWGDYGKHVVISHPDGTHKAVLAHLCRVDVASGDTVSRGQLVGGMGNTGLAKPAPSKTCDSSDNRGIHLHFEIRHGPAGNDDCKDKTTPGTYTIQSCHAQGSYYRDSIPGRAGASVVACTSMESPSTTKCEGLENQYQVKGYSYQTPRAELVSAIEDDRVLATIAPARPEPSSPSASPVLSATEPDLVSQVYQEGATVNVDVGTSRLTVRVNSPTHDGKTVVIDLEEGSIGIDNPADIKVRLDGKLLPLAASYSDVLDPSEAATGRYLVAFGSKGPQVLVYVPHFSERVIEITSGQDEEEGLSIPSPFQGVLLLLVAWTVVRRGQRQQS